MSNNSSNNSSHRLIENMFTSAADFVASGLLDAAQQKYEEILSVSPGNERVFNALGVISHLRGNSEKAEKYFQQALLINSNYAEAWYHLGNLLVQLGRTFDAINCYEHSHAIKPDFVPSLINLGNSFKETGEVRKAIQVYDRALLLAPNSLNTQSNRLLCLQYLETVDDQALFCEALGAGQIISTGVESSKSMVDFDPERRLRIGYISSDFRQHAVSFFFGAVLDGFNKSEFEVFCYSDTKSPDNVTQRFSELANAWRDSSCLSNEELAELIKSDEIDILVDLAGHSAGNRLKLFAMKSAPVQVTWLGYPGTTGIKTIGYRITDAIADPVDKADHYYTERLVRLPNTFLCYRPTSTTPGVSPAPVQRSGFITFGSCATLAKITDHILDLESDSSNGARCPDGLEKLGIQR